ncbi:hypothetical protein ACFX2K_012461 [Malus domestica]
MIVSWLYEKIRNTSAISIGYLSRSFATADQGLIICSQATVISRISQCRLSVLYTLSHRHKHLTNLMTTRTM